MSELDRGSITVTTPTLQFLVQLGVLLATICAFGFSIQNAVQVQAVRQEQQQKTLDSLERKVELLRYDQSQLQLDLASRGVITVRKEK